MNGQKELLRLLIKERVYQEDQVKQFKLSSGKMSHYYFDLKKVLFDMEGLVLVGNIVYEKILELGLLPAAVGGLEKGADPIAVSVAYSSYLRARRINAFSIRKKAKLYGTRKGIDGCFEPGDSVVILEDVITTGASTISAINIARSYSLNVLCVIALVDRCEENGRQNIEALKIDVHSIFTIKDFKAEWKKCENA